jgi:patatin-related protein
MATTRSTTRRSTSRGSTTELRLALVCYGGVSLAVYMHGVTKELHKLARASRAFDAVDDTGAANPFTSDKEADTEATYFEALRSLAEGGRWLSVNIDIIAGTSAGGINGVVLAKALARDTDQRKLKQLWIDEGDLKKLLRAWPIGGVATRGVLAAVRQLFSLNKPTSPLRGEQMSTLLVQALDDMESRAGDSTLMMPNGELELFVTTTDMHGFEVLVPSGVGGPSQRDRYHAQVLQFRGDPHDTSDFGKGANPALAFSARATSCFPGAFAPVSLPSFHQESGQQVTPTEHLFRYPYEELGRQSKDAWFVDGGVLDNAPFDLVIDAIRRHPARTEVVRHVIYVQPDPGRPLEQPAPSRDTSKGEGWLAGLRKTLVGVKGSHPILLELLKLRDLNYKIAQVGDIANREMEEVLAQMKAALEEQAFVDGTTASDSAAAQALGTMDDAKRVQAMSDAMRLRAAELLRPSWATYQRLKVEAAGRRMADEIAARLVYPPDSGRSSFVRAAISEWARSRPEWRDPDPNALGRLLGPVDMPYRERRLMLLLAGVNALYGPPGATTAGPPAEDLNELKHRGWQELHRMQNLPSEVVSGEEFAAVTSFLGADLGDHLYDDPKRFAADHGDEFQAVFRLYHDRLEAALATGSTGLWEAFESVTKSWQPQHRLELLSRYAGFPLWDGIIFPTISLSELPQFTPIGISQFSPLTASVLEQPDGTPKLEGIGMAHFRGFMSPQWRENDYLWGRLDATELVLRTVLQAGRRSTQLKPGVDLVASDQRKAMRSAGDELLLDALAQVLDSESDLGRVRGLRDRIRDQVAGLRGLFEPASATVEADTPPTDVPSLSG